ncbi:MAG: beta-ketoacyl synthase chain length factor [Gammaproteobacteria bacterium]|nr:beta-ketoacyl synthase chain length factor [Gammaproteobacteria bacterium]MBU1481592.1 beta-ketoacyl synthase chain length factor [Gammaproteobacteria bacterium]
MMRMFVEGIGLLGPGLDGWSAGRAVLAGDAAYVAAPTNLRASDMLPAAERRRAGVPIKLALAVGQEAFLQSGCDTRTASTVFTSSGGDNDNVHAINGILATAPREVSPTRFHNSVHNAAAGYWCIAAGSHEPSTSLCAYDASFAAGLLESATQVTIDGAVVAMVAYDHPYPEPLQMVRPITAPFGMALILTPRQSGKSLAALEVEFVAGTTPETTMPEAGLEALRIGVPAARGLPLLSALAGGKPAQISIAYFADNHLNIRVTPC